jgi:hypothetical protein
MVTTIGKTTPLLPAADGDRRATLSPDGNCGPMRLPRRWRARYVRRRRTCLCIKSGSARSASRR